MGLSKCLVCEGKVIGKVIGIIKGTDSNRTMYCENCGIDEKTMELINNGDRRVMNMVEFNMLVKVINIRYPSKDVEVCVNGIPVDNLKNFVNQVSEKSNHLALFNGQPITRDYGMSYGQWVSLKLNTIKEDK